MSFIWDLLDIFLMVRQGLQVFGRKTTGVNCHVHHINGTYYQHDLSLLILALIPWLRWYLPDFSTVKFLFPSLSILHSLEGSHCVEPTLRLWECSYASPTLRVKYLRTLFGILPLGRLVSSCSFMYLFNHLFISV